MNLLTKLQPLIIILSALIGLLLGYVTSLGSFSVHLIEPALMVLLYFVFLSVDGRKLKQSFTNVKFTLTAVTVNFIWTPVFAYVLGMIFFRTSLDLRMGLLMLLVTPCTDWYLVFTALADGNVELGASILPLNLLLQIVLLPVYIFIFFKDSVSVSAKNIIFSILFVLLVPFILSYLTKCVAKISDSPGSKVEWIKEQGDNAQLLFLCLAVIFMFASESKEVFDHPVLLLRMLAPMILFFVVNFLLVRAIGAREHLPAEDMTALNFTTLARNSPLSLAIAVAAFPDRPLISLALVIGPLIELPALGIIAVIIKRIKRQ